MGLLGKLIGKWSAAAPRERSERKPVEYRGFTIQATPEKTGGGWTTAGIISRSFEGTVRTYRFVRADLSMAEEAAVELSLQKGRRIIDEQGERLFTD